MELLPRMALLAAIAITGLALIATTAAAASPVAALPSEPASDQLGAVTCLSTSWCMAVGASASHALAQLWNGRTWTALTTADPSATANVLSGVSCTSTASCMAVGYQNDTDGTSVSLAENWNGSTWRAVPTPDAGTLSAVSCLNPVSCIAVGVASNSGFGQADSEAWNGTAWRALDTPNVGGPFSILSGVSCTAVTRCMAVGYGYANDTKEVPIADEWNGSRWHQMITPPGFVQQYSSLSGVSCTAAAQCMAVGRGGGSDGGSALAVEWNGSTWKKLTVPFGPNLSAISCVTASWCMAVEANYGSIATAFAAQWNGRTWRELTVVSPGTIETDLSGVSCASTTACLAVGQYIIGKLGSSQEPQLRWPASEPRRRPGSLGCRQVTLTSGDAGVEVVANLGHRAEKRFEGG